MFGRTNDSEQLSSCEVGAAGALAKHAVHSYMNSISPFPCAKYSEKGCPAEGCSVTIIEHPTVTCPADFTLHELLGKVSCEKKVYSDLESRCRDGYEAHPTDALLCVKSVQPLTTAAEKRVAAQMICPQGYSDIGVGCLKREITDAQTTCPSGSSLEEISCVEELERIARCPPGSRKEEGACWSYRVTKPFE
eukprot:Selendium_serpulae@DN3366_c0_g1_i1.p1